jgi:uncharacterized membrane protein YdjX (TVP38/TMEM64 family)
MKEGTVEKARKARRLLLVMPVMILLIIASSALAGIILRDSMGASDQLVLPLLTSTIGLLLSVIAAYLLARRI